MNINFTAVNVEKNLFIKYNIRGVYVVLCYTIRQKVVQHIYIIRFNIDYTIVRL